MTALTKKLKSKGIKQLNKPPIWSGPCSELPDGGITFSLLSRWLICRERFRLLVVDGLKPQPKFMPRVEYGNLWHCCEEAHANNKDWEAPLKKYATELIQEYRMEQEQIQHWWKVCKCQFPEYVKHWKKHKDVVQRIPLLQEQVFSVPYKLPSGRTVIIRGKWDSVDLVGPKTKAMVWCQENKTKGKVEDVQIASNLRDDLQSMMYFLVLAQFLPTYASDRRWPTLAGPPAGIRYNVVRRPLAGGKHSIRQKQGETAEEFYDRLGGLISEEPEHYFHRWNVEIAASDLARFEQRFFIPIMEQLCDWWEYMALCDYDPWNFRKGHDPITAMNRHWCHPHGTWNSLNESGSHELDEFLATGSMLGLTKVDKLFTELE